MLRKFLKLNSKAALVGLFSLASLASTVPVSEFEVQTTDGIRYYGKLSQSWKYQVSAAYRQFPRAERNYLIERDVKLALGDSQGSINPFGVRYESTISSDPNEDRTTSNQASGLYASDKKNIAVTEYEYSTSVKQVDPYSRPSKEGISSGQWRAISLSETIGTMRHEFGHAIDFNLQLQPSRSQSFWEAYQKDIVALGGGYAQDGGRLSYFIRLDDEPSGLQETFAEIWACVNGGSNNRITFVKDFPAVTAWMTQFKKDFEIAYAQGPKAVDEFAVSLYRTSSEQAQKRMQTALDTIEKSGRADAKELLKLYDERSAKQSTDAISLRSTRLYTAEFVAAVVSGDPFWKHYREPFRISNTSLLSDNKDGPDASFKTYITTLDAALANWGQQSFIAKIKERNHDEFENFKKNEGDFYQDVLGRFNRSELDTGDYAASTKIIHDILTSDAMGIYNVQNLAEVFNDVVFAFSEASTPGSMIDYFDRARHKVNSFTRTPDEQKLLFGALDRAQKESLDIMRNARQNLDKSLVEAIDCIKSLNDPGLSQAMNNFQAFLEWNDGKAYPGSGKIYYDVVMALSKSVSVLTSPYDYAGRSAQKDGGKIDSTRTKKDIADIFGALLKQISSDVPPEFDSARLQPLKEMRLSMLTYADNITAGKIINNEIDHGIKEDRKSLFKNQLSPQFRAAYEHVATLLSSDSLKQTSNIREAIASILSETSNIAYSMNYQSDLPDFQKNHIEAPAKTAVKRIGDPILRANVVQAIKQLSDALNMEIGTNHAAHVRQRIQEQEREVEDHLKNAGMPALTELYREIDGMLGNDSADDHLTRQELRLHLQMSLIFTDVGQQTSYENDESFHENIQQTKDSFTQLKNKTTLLQDGPLRDAISQRLDQTQKLILDSRVPRQLLAADAHSNESDESLRRPAGVVPRPSRELVAR